MLLRFVFFAIAASVPAAAASLESSSWKSTDDPAAADLKVAFDEAAQAVGDQLNQRMLLRLRRLQDGLPPPPERTCDQVIATVTTEEVEALADLLTAAFIPPGSDLEAFAPLLSSTLKSTIKYDVEAAVICAKCDELRETYTDADFATDDGEDGWLSYCGEGIYGANITHSGLVFRPLDPETGQVFKMKMKAHVYMHGTTTYTPGTPSEVWPDSLATYLASGDPEDALYNLLDTIAPVMASTSGVISIVPDYIGFGQAYQYPKSFGAINLYQQAAVSLFLQEQNDLFVSSGGCSVLDNIATAGGYSEGGFAVVAAARALDRLSVDILTVTAGGAPFDPSGQVAWLVEQYDAGAPLGPVAGVALAFAGYAFSSTNPDFVNTGVGQDMLAEEWSNSSDYSRNVKAWIADGLSFFELIELIPPYGPDIYNPTFVSMLQESNALNLTEPCDLAEVGVTDKLCEALLANELDEKVQAATFPVVICHSPDDRTVSILNAPDVDANENLTEFSLGGGLISASGDHATSYFICTFAAIYPFTSSFTDAATNTMEPVEGCSSMGTEPPTEPPTDPSSTTPPATSGPTMSTEAPSSAVLTSFSFLFALDVLLVTVFALA